LSGFRIFRLPTEKEGFYLIEPVLAACHICFAVVVIVDQQGIEKCQVNVRFGKSGKFLGAGRYLFQFQTEIVGNSKNAGVAVGEILLEGL